MKKRLWLIGALILTLIFCGAAAQANDAGSAVTLTVNGSTAEQTAASNEVVRLVVQAPGATAVWTPTDAMPARSARRRHCGRRKGRGGACLSARRPEQRWPHC